MMSAVLALAIELLVRWLTTKARADQVRADLIEERHELDITLSAARQQLSQEAHWRDECGLLSSGLRNLHSINISLEANLRGVTTRLETTQQHTEDRIRQTINSEQRLSGQFGNLTNRVSKHDNRCVDEQNRQSLNSLLVLLRERLDGFRHQVRDGFGKKMQERHTLACEIRNLRQLNTQMMREAMNLARTLKRDNKTQGNQGEVVLMQILRTSGLREDYEHEAQVSIENDAHSRMQPDIIVRLPQGKDVVIDAKMTLITYERHLSAEDEYTCESALQEHTTSARNHIHLPGHKDYQQLPGLRTLNYALVFIPVELAFLPALDRQSELITRTPRNNIMLVSPTMLLVAPCTIANLQRYERQSRNAQRIADRTSKLYDKMRLFVDGMSAIGQNLDRAQNNYRQAIERLSSDRGNVLSQAEAFRSLGAEIKREVNPELTEQATTQDEEYCLRSVSETQQDASYSEDEAVSQQPNQPTWGS